MKQKVADYIADYIAKWGIRDVFTVTGDRYAQRGAYRVSEKKTG